MDSNQDRLNFVKHVTDKIESSTRQKISMALLELFSAHDTIIATSLGVNVNKIVHDTIVSEIKTIKEE